MIDNSDIQHETEFLIFQILSVAPTTAKAIPKVFQAVGENLGWAVGNFWKLDPSDQKLHCDQIWVDPSIKTPEFFEINQKRIFAPGDGMPGEVWKSEKPQWIPDLSRSAHYPLTPSAVNNRLMSAMAFPISLGDRMLGVMEFYSSELKVLDKTLLQTLHAIGLQLGQFIGRKEAEDKLQLAYDEMEQRVQERTAELLKSNLDLQLEIAERKKVEKEVLDVTQKEQRRFGSQLHDGLCQDLTGILMFAKFLTQKMEKENSLEIAELKKISDMLLVAADQARDTARGLYPGELEGTTLMNSLIELTARTERLSGIACRFICPDPIVISDNDIATHLYRIAQEGVSNAVKHGQSHLIEVSLSHRGDDIALIIKDDGVGLVPGAQNSKGIGFHIMKYRAHMLDASFQVEPNVPHGVVLKCILKGTPCTP